MSVLQGTWETGDDGDEVQEEDSDFHSAATAFQRRAVWNTVRTATFPCPN